MDVLAGVGRDEDALNAAQVGWCLFDEVCKPRELRQSNHRDRLQFVRLRCFVDEPRHQG